MQIHLNISLLITLALCPFVMLSGRGKGKSKELVQVKNIGEDAVELRKKIVNWVNGEKEKRPNYNANFDHSESTSIDHFDHFQHLEHSHEPTTPANQERVKTQYRDPVSRRNTQNNVDGNRSRDIQQPQNNVDRARSRAIEQSKHNVDRIRSRDIEQPQNTVDRARSRATEQSKHNVDRIRSRDIEQPQNTVDRARSRAIEQSKHNVDRIRSRDIEQPQNTVDRARSRAIEQSKHNVDRIRSRDIEQPQNTVDRIHSWAIEQSKHNVDRVRSRDIEQPQNTVDHARSRDIEQPQNTVDRIRSRDIEQPQNNVDRARSRAIEQSKHIVDRVRSRDIEQPQNTVDRIRSRAIEQSKHIVDRVRSRDIEQPQNTVDRIRSRDIEQPQNTVDRIRSRDIEQPPRRKSSSKKLNTRGKKPTIQKRNEKSLEDLHNLQQEMTTVSQHLLKNKATMRKEAAELLQRVFTNIAQRPNDVGAHGRSFTEPTTRGQQIISYSNMPYLSMAYNAYGQKHRPKLSGMVSRIAVRMQISYLFVLLLTLALCTCVILTPLDKADDGNGQKEQTENLDKQVEEMRKKFLALSDRWKKRREEEEMHQSDDSDHSETSHIDQSPKKKRNKQKMALRESPRHERGGRDVGGQEAAGSSRQSAATNRSGHLRSKSDEYSRRNELHESGRRQIVQYSNVPPPYQIGSSKDHHIPRHPKKNVQSTAGSTRQGKQIVVYTEKPIIQKRKEKSVDDLQTLQNQMNALMAQNSENKKDMRQEAEASLVAYNLAAPRSAIQPKFDGFLDKLTRKMTPEPENWKKGLANMLRADVQPIQQERGRWRNQNAYDHDSWWCFVSGERCLMPNHCQDGVYPERTNEHPPESPEKASGIVIDDKPAQNYLLEYENTKKIDKMQQSDVSDDEVAVNSATVQDEELTNYIMSQEKLIALAQEVLITLSKVITMAQEMLIVNMNQILISMDQEILITKTQKNLVNEGQEILNSNADCQDAPIDHHGTRSSDHQNARKLEQQGSLNSEDKFDEDEQLSRALKESAEEAKSMAQLKHREDDQVVIAMQKSVQDEIERRQSSKKGKLKHKPSSSKRPTNNNSDDDDLVLQKAIQASLSDLR
ncbi:hypothetical protein GPALN_010805 [Globodera pallida]|nr:hypothetical protein GPALN_010805 [Globodera pallida]